MTIEIGLFVTILVSLVGAAWRLSGQISTLTATLKASHENSTETRAELKEVQATVGNHGERIAKLETRVGSY
jgi:hypothetical protein